MSDEHTTVEDPVVPDARQPQSQHDAQQPLVQRNAAGAGVREPAVSGEWQMPSKTAPGGGLTERSPFKKTLTTPNTMSAITGHYIKGPSCPREFSPRAVRAGLFSLYGALLAAICLTSGLSNREDCSLVNTSANDSGCLIPDFITLEVDACASFERVDHVQKITCLSGILGALIVLVSFPIFLSQRQSDRISESPSATCQSMIHLGEIFTGISMSFAALLLAYMFHVWFATPSLCKMILEKDIFQNNISLWEAVEFQTYWLWLLCLALVAHLSQLVWNCCLGRCCPSDSETVDKLSGDESAGLNV